jgi:hypothetical protein
MRCAKIRKDRTAAREMPPSDQAASTVEYQNAHAAEYCEEMGLPPETRRYCVGTLLTRAVGAWQNLTGGDGYSKARKIDRIERLKTNRRSSGPDVI